MRHCLLILLCITAMVIMGSHRIYSVDMVPEKDITFKKAVKYFFQRKFSMAEILLQESLKKNPENKLAYSYLGDIFFIRKRYAGALGLYKKAIDLDHNVSENYFRMGQIYYYKKQGAQALSHFQKSIELDPNLKYVHYHIGLTHLMLLRDKLNTIRSWENYLRIAPEDPQYEKLRRVVELLRDPNFQLPKKGSDISIEEALHLGGAVLKKKERLSKSQKADHEKKKSKNKLEDIERDDDL